MSALENSKHHYVPQLILRNFCFESRETLHAFDKQANRQFQVAVRDAAAERGFNTFKTDYAAGCGEEMFTDIETKAAPIIQKIVGARRLQVSDKEKPCLIVFVAAQMLRSKLHRSILDDIGEILLELKERHPTLETPSEIRSLDNETKKQVALTTFKDQLLEASNAFLNKDLLLFEAPQSFPLIIGDNPLVRFNTLNRSELVGTNGLLSEGVEIYLPLSPHLILGFMCPTIRRHQEMSVISEGRQAEAALDYLCSIEYGTTAKLRAENVLHFNSMQVINATRFLYGSTVDFTVVQKMIAHNPDIRDRPRLISSLAQVAHT